MFPKREALEKRMNRPSWKDVFPQRRILAGDSPRLHVRRRLPGNAEAFAELEPAGGIGELDGEVGEVRKDRLRRLRRGDEKARRVRISAGQVLQPGINPDLLPLFGWLR
jgi:hypothetical protein